MQAGCLSKSLLESSLPSSPGPGRGKRPSRPRFHYDECACVREAWAEFNTSLSPDWVKRDHLPKWKHVTNDVVQRWGENKKPKV